MNNRTEKCTNILTKRCSWTASLAFHAILAIAFINNPSGSPNSKKSVYQHQQELSFANVVWEEKPVSNNTIIKSKARGWATTPESLLEQKMHLSSGDQLIEIERVVDTIVVKNKLPDDSRTLANEVEVAMLQSTEVTGLAVRNTVNSNLKPPIESKSALGKRPQRVFWKEKRILAPKINSIKLRKSLTLLSPKADCPIIRTLQLIKLSRRCVTLLKFGALSQKTLLPVS